MTYRELRDTLNQFTDEQLNQGVSVLLFDSDMISSCGVDFEDKEEVAENSDEYMVDCVTISGIGSIQLLVQV